MARIYPDEYYEDEDVEVQITLTKGDVRDIQVIFGLYLKLVMFRGLRAKRPGDKGEDDVDKVDRISGTLQSQCPVKLFKSKRWSKYVAEREAEQR